MRGGSGGEQRWTAARPLQLWALVFRGVVMLSAPSSPHSVSKHRSRREPCTKRNRPEMLNFYGHVFVSQNGAENTCVQNPPPCHAENTLTTRIKIHRSWSNNERVGKARLHYKCRLGKCTVKDLSYMWIILELELILELRYILQLWQASRRCSCQPISQQQCRYRKCRFNRAWHFG